jgi:hypothetical protein
MAYGIDRLDLDVASESEAAQCSKRKATVELTNAIAIPERHLTRYSTLFGCFTERPSQDFVFFFHF